MKSLEWAMALFFSAIGVSLLTINLMIMFSAYKLLTKIQEVPQVITRNVVFDEGAHYWIDQIDVSKSVPV